MPRNQRPGSERARDEQRSERTPRYEGGPWHDATPMSPEPPSEVPADTKIESGGERAGVGRVEKPRKLRQRTKPNPKPRKKTKKKR